MEQEPQPNRHRPKISRDMIGQPTNFRHTSHVGSSDIGEMSTLQSTMKGKGDEEMQHIQVPHIMNARSIHELKRTSLKAWESPRRGATETQLCDNCDTGDAARVASSVKYERSQEQQDKAAAHTTTTTTDKYFLRP